MGEPDVSILYCHDCKTLFRPLLILYHHLVSFALPPRFFTLDSAAEVPPRFSVPLEGATRVVLPLALSREGAVEVVLPDLDVDVRPLEGG